MANTRDLMGFTYDEAARLAGLSRNRLDRILSTGVHDPEHPSSILSFRDLVALRTIARLRDKYHVPLPRLRKAYVYMLEHAHCPWAELKVGAATKKDVGFWNPTTEIWELANETGQMVAAFTIAEVEEEMAAAVIRDRQRKPEDVGQFDRTRGVMGKALCFKGTRIPRSVVIDYIREGASNAEILDEYPSLTIEDIDAAKKLAS